MSPSSSDSKVVAAIPVITSRRGSIQRQKDEEPSVPWVPVEEQGNLFLKVPFQQPEMGHVSVVKTPISKGNETTVIGLDLCEFAPAVSESIPAVTTKYPKLSGLSVTGIYFPRF